MDAQLLFTLTFPLAAPFWALMILAPGWSVTRRVIGSPLIVVPPMLVYAALVLPQFSTVFAAVASPDCSRRRSVRRRAGPTSSRSTCSWAASSSSTAGSAASTRSWSPRCWC
jgi:hypothetical protein